MRSSYHLRWRQGVLLLIQQFKWKITFLLLAASYLINVLIWRSRHVTSYNCPWSLLAGGGDTNRPKKKEGPSLPFWGQTPTQEESPFLFTSPAFFFSAERDFVSTPL